MAGDTAAAVTGRRPCNDCPVAELCLVGVLPSSHSACVNRSLCFRKKLAADQALYRAGDLLSAVYVIRSGSFKSRLVGESGRDQITGIHLRGEVVGIEGIASGVHTCSLIALEHSVVCIIPMDVLDGLATELPGVQRWLHRALGREIVAATRDLTLLGGRKAEERLAAFLLEMSQRLASSGQPAREFDLRLTREDIASHLGLNAATVSRAFARLGREGALSTRQRHVRLRDVDVLARYAAGRGAGAGLRPARPPGCAGRPARRDDEGASTVNQRPERHAIG